MDRCLNFPTADNTGYADERYPDMIGLLRGHLVFSQYVNRTVCKKPLLNFGSPVFYEYP